jgi:hypothetical protein
MDPDDRLVRARAATALLRKGLGFRYTLDVVPLDPTPVRGSHGRLPDDPADGPVLISSVAGATGDRFAATGVRDLLLRLGGAA